MKYTFVSLEVGKAGSSNGDTSSQRFDTIEDAASAAASWSAICFLNNWFVFVRIIEVKD